MGNVIKAGRALLLAVVAVGGMTVITGCRKAVLKEASEAVPVAVIADLTPDGTFIVSGAGPMDDFEDDRDDRAGNQSGPGCGCGEDGEDPMEYYREYERTHRPWRYDIHDIVNAVIGDSVTHIGKRALDGCIDMRTVTLGKSTVSVGSEAFKECVNLTSVIFLSPVPPALEHDSFDEVDKSAVCLYVPAGSADAYASAKYFADFKCVKTADNLSAATFRTLYKALDTLPVAVDTLTDARDDKTYKTAKMPDGAIWMVENINYDTADGIGSWCYEDSVSYCGEYGRLYDWNTATAVCPAGYHLPSRQEWENLVNAAGGARLAGKRLKARSGWSRNGSYGGNGKDNYGFSALPGGHRIGKKHFFNITGSASWWTTEETADGKGAFYRTMGYSDYTADENYDEKNNGNYVRCVKDAATSPVSRPAKDGAEL